MAGHLDLRQINQLLAETRSAGGELAVRISSLKRLLAGCPAFAPALLELGRLLQVSDDSTESGTPPLAEAEQLLEQALIASDRSPRMLSELAYFKHAIKDDLTGAISLFGESLNELLRLFEEASLGMASALSESNEVEQAIEVIRRALAVAPNSPKLLDALEHALLVGP